MVVNNKKHLPNQLQGATGKDFTTYFLNGNGRHGVKFDFIAAR
jgi:hypothetical protein